MKTAGRAALAALGWLVLLVFSPLIGFLVVLACGVFAAWYWIVAWQWDRAIRRERKTHEQLLREADRILAETMAGKYDRQILSDQETMRRARSRWVPGSKTVN